MVWSHISFDYRLRTYISNMLLKSTSELWFGIGIREGGSGKQTIHFLNWLTISSSGVCRRVGRRSLDTSLTTGFRRRWWRRRLLSRACRRRRTWISGVRYCDFAFCGLIFYCRDMPLAPCILEGREHVRHSSNLCCNDSWFWELFGCQW